MARMGYPYRPIHRKYGAIGCNINSDMKPDPLATSCVFSNVCTSAASSLKGGAQPCTDLGLHAEPGAYRRRVQMGRSLVLV